MIEFDADRISFGLIGGVLTEIKAINIKKITDDRFGRGGFTSTITVATEEDIYIDSKATIDVLLFSENKIYILFSNKISISSYARSSCGSVVCLRNSNCEIASSYREVASIMSAYNQKL